MKLNIFLVTYKGDERIEERWEDIPEEERKQISKELSDRFMKRAGFSPIERSDEVCQT